MIGQYVCFWYLYVCILVSRCHFRCLFCDWRMICYHNHLNSRWPPCNSRGRPMEMFSQVFEEGMRSINSYHIVARHVRNLYHFELWWYLYCGLSYWIKHNSKQGLVKMRLGLKLLVLSIITHCNSTFMHIFLLL